MHKQILIIIMLLSILSIDSMQNNKIELAREYNKNHNFFFKDTLNSVISLLENEDHTTSFNPARGTYEQLKAFVVLYATCDHCNKLMPFSKIVTFCKKLKSVTRDQTLEIVTENYPRDKYVVNLICSALIQAGANANTDYEGAPLFFYAKSVERAKLCIALDYNIHKLSKSKNDILTHVMAKEYSSSLLKFYLEKGVIPRLSALHDLVSVLKDYCINEHLINEFLKKCECILRPSPQAPLPQRVKNNLNLDGKTPKTPLDKLYDMDITQEFKKRISDLFIQHGCRKLSDIVDFLNGMYGNPGKLVYNNPEKIMNSTYKIIRLEQDIEKYYSHAELHPEINKKQEKIIKQPIYKPCYQLTFKDEVIFAMNDGFVEETVSIVNERDGVGNTLLISAVIKNDIAMVRALLKNGANPEELSSDGRTALEIAMENGDDDIAALLIDACETKLGG